jgi:hypothetical protein
VDELNLDICHVIYFLKKIKNKNIYLKKKNWPIPLSQGGGLGVAQPPSVHTCTKIGRQSFRSVCTDSNASMTLSGLNHCKKPQPSMSQVHLQFF